MAFRSEKFLLRTTLRIVFLQDESTRLTLERHHSRTVEYELLCSTHDSHVDQRGPDLKKLAELSNRNYPLAGAGEHFVRLISTVSFDSSLIKNCTENESAAEDSSTTAEQLEFGTDLTCQGTNREHSTPDLFSVSTHSVCAQSKRVSRSTRTCVGGGSVFTLASCVSLIFMDSSWKAASTFTSVLQLVSKKSTLNVDAS